MKYEISAADARQQIESIFNKCIIPAYPGADALLAWMKESDFFTAPASTRFHGSVEGGLCIHSLAVYENLVRIDNCFGFCLNQASMALCALTHDLCKCNFYKVSSRNVKDDATGRWMKVPFYTVEDKTPYGFHGPKSAFIVKDYVPSLSWEESSAISCHMGFSDQTSMTDISNVYENNKLAWALHVADEATTWVDKY